MSDQNENVAQFKAITGVDEDRARFYLDSAAGQLEVAIARYYENDESDNVEMVEDGPRGAEPPVGAEDAHEAAPRPPAKKKVPAAAASRPTKFATLNTLNASSDEDEEEGQAYYAGGSEHSGQQVLGPPKKRDIVADMFKSVKEHGVEILEPHSSGSGPRRPFRGPGYLLGQDSNDSEVVPGVEEPPPPMEVTLRLWQNGFCVNDGELRSYTDPANKDFLESIRRGQIPRELMQGTSEVHLAMEDHRMEAYKPSGKKKAVKAFQGHGYTLGSPAPTVVESSSSPEDNSTNETKAKEAVKVDNTKPTTSLQIRLADGSRLVGQFNHDHTIESVRRFIEAARPQYQSQPFNLLTSYPSKVLEDSQTLQSAGILNAAIMQKLM